MTKSTNYKIENINENLNSHTGLVLIGSLLDRTNFKNRVANIHLHGCSDPVISNSDVLTSMIGLQCIATPMYSAIEQFRNTPNFIKSLGIDYCPSSATLRQRFDLVGNEFDHIIKEESALLIKNTIDGLTPVETLTGPKIPLDIDVTPFDNSKTKKEGVSRTYKGYDGFAPILSYLGGEGYIVNLEFREGKQHCQNGTVEFLMETLWYANLISDLPVLVRLDSGNDCIDNIKVCIESGVDWLIKRNIRKEKKEDWLEIAKTDGEIYFSDDRSICWRGKTTIEHEDIDEPLSVAFEITEIKIDKKGQKLLIPEIKIDTYWSSLTDDAEKIIKLYHQHGESEQFHSEIKSDMDLERLPSQKFETNALILLIGSFSFNMLRLCGQESLKITQTIDDKTTILRPLASRRRIRTVIQDLIYIASHITKKARDFFISFGSYSSWKVIWEGIYKNFKAPVVN